ncbi:MAG: tetratricopeptide repeat protein [Planctomycetes bacterium]|nr:tetratricopeptide repeat protein [Planctomycetota bacterium]
MPATLNVVPLLPEIRNQKSEIRNRLAFCLVPFAFCLSAAMGGAIEDAKAALAAKKYDQVDVALEKLLAQEKAPEEALRLSLDAALASGKVLTAQKRVSALLQLTQTPDLLYLGGEIADRAGDANLAVARFLTFARAVNERSDKLAAAIRYLLRRNTYPEEFKKYVALFGPDGTAWTLGYVQLDRLLQAGEAEKALDVAGVLMERFPTPERVGAVHRRLKTSSDRLELGGGDKERYLALIPTMLKGRPDEWGDFDQVFSNAARVMPPEEQVRCAFAVQAILAKEPLWSGMFQRFANIRSFANEDARIAEGRKLLALEPLYRDGKDPAHYEMFFTNLADSPQVFAVANKVLIPPDEMLRKFDVLAAKLAKTPWALRQQVSRVAGNYLGGNTPAAIAFIKKNIAIVDPQAYSQVLEATKGEGFEALLNAAAQGRGYNEVLELRTHALKWYDAAKNGAQLLAIAREYMGAFPGSFDWGRVHNNVMLSPNVDMDSKLNLLAEILAKGGGSRPMAALLGELVKIADAQKKRPWADHPRFQALKKDCDDKKPGSDPLMNAHTALHNLQVNSQQFNQAVFEAYATFLKAYPGRIPGGWEKTRNAAEVLVHGIASRAGSAQWDNRQGLCQWAELTAPRLDLGSLWEGLARRTSEHQARPTLHKIAPAYVALCQGAERGDPAVWAHLKGALNPRTDPKSLFASCYDKLGGENALSYLAGQEALAPQLAADEMAKIVAMPGFAFTSRTLASSLIHTLYQRAGATCKVAPGLIKALWDYCRAEQDKAGSFNVMTEAYAYGLYTKLELKKEADAWLAAYLDSVGKRPAPQQIEALASIAQSLPVEAEKKLLPGQRVHTLLKRLAPVYQRVPAADWPLCTVYDQVLDDVNGVAANWAAPEKDEATQFLRLQVDMVLEGTRHAGRGTSLFAPVQRRIAEAIGKEDWPQASRLTRYYAGILRWENDWSKVYQDHIVPIVEKLQAKNAHELAYVFMVEVERRNRPGEEFAKQLAILKAKVAREVTGLLPVAPGHPTYDLHVAAQALSLGNETRAWELTAPKLKLLPESWTALDPQFVAWAVDQMRKQKLLKEALELSFTVLLREFDLDAEVAAAVSLTKGDVYADMQNYQAARIEYEGLKNNKRYARTEAGSKARYRLIQLLILTKDYATAENHLERLLDSDNLETQAEAHFLRARIAFEQNDYEQSKEQLKEVFKRKHDHVEARLLEGELKLLVPRGLASTEVLIGNPRLRTVAIPGRILTLKLQDANLSVARGGAAVPVIVTTAPGGDLENVKLLPSSGEKNLFVGTIATALGKVEKNNLQLEVRGNDTISYVIEPEFQKANDLHYPPKTLEVKYDARLVASAGEILSEEEAEKRAMELRLARERGVVESRRFEGRSGSVVRPGSPIYVQVTDLDCDLTDEKDKLPVDLKTSSGDLLKGFKLEETGPHTGMFRGAVPTGIPLPKATASDTQEGKDPSVMVNTTKQGVWTSLADGQKPKGIEVDTMSSHLVKTVSLEMPDPKKVRQVALLGALAGADDVMLLAAHPKGYRGSGSGLKGEYYTGTSLNPTALKLTRVDPVIDFDFSKKPPDRTLGNQNLSVRWTGYIQPRHSETYTFTVRSDDGVRLFIDGKKVAERWVVRGTGEDNVTIDLEAGKKHEIMIEYFQSTGEAAITLSWQSKSQKKEVVPTWALFPGTEAQEAATAKADLVVTDTGLSVTLPEPIRLRKLTWVFDDFEGEAVTVKKFTIKDAADKVIVPGKEDFTTGTTNATLEVAPGDKIEVTYNDERRNTKDAPGLTATLNSSYFNGSILLANEVIEQRGEEKWTDYQPAKRCRDGDQLMIIVTDYDEDLTDKRDTVKVEVKSSSGEKLALDALESWVNDTTGERHNHSGVFLALLRLGKKTEKDTLKLAPGDVITASVLDKENTRPGVPVERVYTVEEAGRSKPSLLIYRTTLQSVEDKSEDAKAKLRRMAIRGKKAEETVIYRDEIIARHPEYEEPPAPGGKSEIRNPKSEMPKEPPKEAPKGEPPKGAKGETGKAGEPAEGPKSEIRNPKSEIEASVQAPLLFELTYPKAALNSGSVLTITAVAESELAAAKKANRKPAELKVPMYLKDMATVARDKGYRFLQVLRPKQSALPRRTLPSGQTLERALADERLAEGRFAGIIRLQIGSPGDQIDDIVVGGTREFTQPTEGEVNQYYYRVPTLIVSGSDVIQLRVEDIESKEVTVAKVRLLSNARLELLDMAYTAQKDALHLGESFYVRVTDPDHDRSDAQDKVAVQVAAASGDKLALDLTETLPHSGVFTGSFKPEFLGEKATEKPNPNDQTLGVRFGDEVTFTYRDDTSMLSKEPVDVVVKGRVHYGSDCELATFTKRFKDPEMAVKTRFLMAEALFEMAKEHRKLGQTEKANDEIARGKAILEEALRDYPHTGLAAQGEFLLANLAQELDRNQEAIGRYSNIISNWPDSEYASRSQFKKAICLEKMGNYEQACEEYVKVTYIYPDSPLVADATVRLGNYYYKQKAYKVAGKVFFKFQQRNPTHALACKSLFLSAQCYMKMEDYKESVRLLTLLIDEYTEDKEVRAEAMYWLGDSYFKDRNYAKAYQTFKKLTWDYPESKWAKIARGRLTEDELARFEEERM